MGLIEDHIKEVEKENNLRLHERAKEDQIREYDRKTEDLKKDIKEFKEDLDNQTETLNELIKSIDISLGRFSNLNKDKK